MFLNTKMSKMHVNHSCVVEDPAKIYSVAALRAKQLFFSACKKIFFRLVKMTFGLVDVSKTDFLCSLVLTFCDTFFK